YEPILSVDIKTPKEYMGAVMGLISQHRGRVENTVDEGDQVRVVGILPTAETLGDFADKIRSATSGRSFWGYQFKAFEPLPTQMEVETIIEIRKRKGLSEEVPVPENWARFVYRRM
ncbi:MAG: elongation factor EF-2, partial [Candidatus Heimdallarchaeota archaeon]